jgi:hypothetical protein
MQIIRSPKEPQINDRGTFPTTIKKNAYLKAVDTFQRI